MKCLKILMVIAVVVFLVSLEQVSAQVVSGYSGVSRQVRPSFQAIYGPGDRLQTYWPILGDEETCNARQDVILQVSPAGCEPAVVRSDLLAEQNVPVFCQVDALQINPLLDIERIRSISFSQKDYPEGVVGTGFHPARAALRSRDKLLGSPLINNIGYITVVLKRNPVEEELPESVEVDLTALVDYEAGNAFGVGRAEFVLQEMSDLEWENEKFKQSFWNGRYFVRLDEADPNFAIVSIYNGREGLVEGSRVGRITSVKVEKGQTSREIWVPGAHCRAGLEVAYDGFIGDKDRALIEIGNRKGSDRIEVFEGSNFLDNECRVERVQIDSSTNETGSVFLRCQGSERIELRLGEKNSSESGSGETEDKVLGGSFDEEFDELVETLERVADEYPAEREVDAEGAQRYGEAALVRAIELSETAGKERTKIRLMKKFIELYPDSEFALGYRDELEEMDEIDFSESTGVVVIDGRFYNIRLVDLQKPRKRSSAEFRVTGARDEIAKVHLEELKEGFEGREGTLDSLRLDRIFDEERVRITATCRKSVDESEGSLESKSLSLKFGEDAVQVCDKSFVSLRDVEIKQAAKIRLLPNVRGTRTETNLTVRIGIEKRAIQLSTEKTASTIESLNRSVEEWENINDKLGKLVEGMKSACFATAGVLTVANFFSGIGGEAVARERVMTGENGWNRICADAESRGEYVSVDQCYLDNRDRINGDVKIVSEEINDLSEKIGGIESNFEESEGVLGLGSSVDRSRAAVAYCEELLSSGRGDQKIETVNGEKSLNEIIGGAGSCEEAYNNGVFGYNELRDIELNLRLKERDGISSGLDKNSDLDLKSSYNNILQNKLRADEIERISVDRELGLPDPARVGTEGRTRVLAEVVSRDSLKDDSLRSGLESEFVSSVVVDGSRRTATDDDPRTGFEGGLYIFGTRKGGEGDYDVTEVFRRNEDGSYEKLDDSRTVEFLDIYRVGKVVPAERESYINSYENPEVRYYEREPYKGLPAVVPFDTREGWYAATRQTLPVFGSRGSFDESGRVMSFYLCNVGKNGREQFFEGVGDDICQLINLNTGQPLGFFPGLSESEARQKVNEAIQAIEDVSNQYGNNIVSVRGRDFKVGLPAAAIPGMQCQNFMSPQECHILFNVCDPVICPSSRCDLGGKYPVADVVQTGIIGSTLLCLPNVQEGIFMPVCLTGIHAGIEGYVSVLQSYRDCLSESLETGRTVGICDAVHSVYMCEFFWRQVAPVAKVILPKIVESAYGQGTRGGGEYLTVMAAWQNTQNSIEFFTQSYGVNSLKAFRARSVEEAGGEFCKGFVSVKAPTNIDTLVEPDSPSQFHAWFSSSTFSDVTVPATSQYKVFYHIFAGNDQGAHYSVYLKNPPESSFYNIPAVVQVAAGFAGRGEFVQETRDFTAPEGYRELCVRVNDQEECGFKQVSTSFALNYLRDEYSSSEIAETDIKSEQECISGRSVLRGDLEQFGSVIQPTAQGAVDEALVPEVYKRGIVRICSTQNPGSATDPTRFVEVGYCDDRQIKCWLDERSVEKAITDNNLGVKGETLEELQEIQAKNLGIDVLGDDDVSAEIRRLEKIVVEIESGDFSEEKVDNVLAELNGLFDRTLFNHRKAEILYLQGRVKAGIFENKLRPLIREKNDDVVIPPRDEDLNDQDDSENQEELLGYYLSQEYEGDPDVVVNIIKRTNFEERVFLRIEGRRIYIPGEDKIFIGRVASSVGEGDWVVELVEPGSFGSFKDYVEGRKDTQDISEEELMSYYDFEGALFKSNKVELS